MADPVPIRGKIPDSLKTGDSTFLGLTKDDLHKRSVDYMLMDLAKSGLVPEDISADELPYIYPGAFTAYFIPYYTPTGVPLVDSAGHQIMWRRKQLLLLNAPKEIGKYSQPPHDKIGNLASHPYFPPAYGSAPEGEVWICEGEKKAASVVKHLGKRAIGIGGCDNWRDPSNKDKLHPLIIEQIANATDVRLVPDGDIGKVDITRAYSALLLLIQGLGKTVQIAKLPEDKKIDDLIVEGKREFEWTTSMDVIEGLPLTGRRFQLTTSGAGDRTMVDQHEANICRVLEFHPIFQEIWFNTDKDRLVYGGEANSAVHETILTVFQRRFGFNKLKLSHVRNAILAVVQKRRRSPFMDRVRFVHTQYDKQERLGTWLIDYCGAPDTPHVREAGLKWLVGLIARADSPGCPMDFMLIAQGAQGIGKSSMPACLVGAHNVATVIEEKNPNNFKMLIHSALVISFEELEAMQRAEQRALKAIITNRVDNYRPPWGPQINDSQRRCVFYGSTNNTEFLGQDPTGQRRYAVVEFRGRVKFKELERDADMLLAEAYDLYLSGTVDFSNVTTNTEVSAKYVIEDFVEGELDELLGQSKMGTVLRSVTNKGREGYWTTINTIMKLLPPAHQRTPTNRVGELLRARGFEDHGKLTVDKGVTIRRAWFITKEKYNERYS